MKRHFTQAALLAALGILVAGCATPIAKIESNPEKYAGQTVTVRGIVVDAFNVPGVDLSFYSLSDGSARMPVLARSERREGQEMTVAVRVIAIAGEEAAEQAASSVEELARYLVDQDIVASDRAQRIAGRIIQAIRRLGQGVTGSYLLVEADREP
jgi:hypothetical protein